MLFYMRDDGFQLFEKLDLRYPGIQPANEGSEAVCLNDFLLIVSGKATYKGVEEAMLDEDVVDVTPIDDKIFQVGCRVVGCGVEVTLERDKGWSVSSSSQCSTYEQLRENLNTN